MKHAPLIITGPSGVGKGTLLTLLRGEFPMRFAIGHTSRAPRAGEQHGIHYYFVERAFMETKIAEGGFFLEHVEHYGNLYGISWGAFRDVQDSGGICVFDLLGGGIQIIRDAKVILIIPPSREELERRLWGRGTETPESFAIRMRSAEGHKGLEVDYTVINAVLEVAHEEIRQKLFEWYPHLRI